MDSLPIINKSYELYKHFTEAYDHMTKKWRLTLGKSVEEGILGLMEQLVMAKNAPKTLKIRLVLELKLMNETRVFQLQAEAQEIGRMLGGWLKSSQSQ